MRAILSSVMLLLITLPVPAQYKRNLPEGEKRILIEKYEKALKDPLALQKDFSTALNFFYLQTMIEKGKGPSLGILLSTVEFYRKDESTSRRPRAKDADDKLGTIMSKLVYAEYRQPGTVSTHAPKSIVPILVDMLTAKRADHLKVIRFLGNMGEAASSAVPALEKLRDGSEKRLALPAYRAIKKIRGE